VPELPEVETVVRTVRPHVVAHTIRDARFFAPRSAQGRPEEMAARLAGQRIHAVRRTGKHILFDLDEGVLDIHLRMTGKLLCDAARGPYTRALLELDRGSLAFEDVRQFGYLVWRAEDPPLGPDMLSIPASGFLELLRRSRSRLKPLLLDQSKVAGLGNIYVDESLHRAGLHPLSAASRVSRRRAAHLHETILQVLQESLDAGGSSISDYVDAAGRRGSFQASHRVYGREGEPCLCCGATIRRILVGQRGTHYCPLCQKR
jgi:formamidopyrimidine-DNA glycosylase